VKADLSKGTYTYEPRKNQPEFKCETAGTVYKVQFELTDAELYREVAEGNKTIVFSGDVDEDGKKKYTIACFSEKEEADEFLQYLQGIKIPCILTTYVEGKKTN
ncbi:MAG TPA: hypothetical protein DCM08_10825, partial [Microscillaceae bacterium]|nr:hypothetical protein [Microscillaceae bacterium]